MGNLKDYATGTVAVAPVTATAGTTLDVQTGEGARYPATPFYATAHDPQLFPTLDNAEKIQVTDVTGDTLTIVRAQGDTTAQSIAIGWRISNAIFRDDFSLGTISIENQIGTPTGMDTLLEAYTSMWSAGITSGAAITDNGNGTVDIAAGEAVLRSTASETGTLYSISFSAQTGITLTNNTTNYVYIDYNGGSPTFNVGTSVTDFNCQNKCVAYIITRETNTLTIVDARSQNVDANRKHRRLLLETTGYNHVIGGSILSETGTRNIAVTSGAFYFDLARIDHAAFDTSAASTFAYYYRNGSGGWTKTTGNTQINNTQYDDGSGTLATVSNNNYSVFWVYIVLGATPSLAVQFGQGNYANVASARASLPPSAPPALAGTGALIGRITIEKSASTFSLTESVFNQVFSGSTALNHNNLAGLQGGTTGEYYHFTSAEHTNLQSAYYSGGTDVPIADGGTGASTASGARTNLGLGSLATLSTVTLTTDVTGVLPIANGGTGASTAAGAAANLAVEFGKLLYPVGCIYFSTNSTNPATSLGFGTWSAFGAGRVPVGFNGSDTDFDTDEETGGAKTVAGASHTHDLSDAGWAQVVMGSAVIAMRRIGGVTAYNETHRHTTTNSTPTNGQVNAAALDGATDSATPSATSVVQPYIVVRMWKRTA